MFGEPLSDPEQGLSNPKPGEDVRLRGIPVDEPIFILRASDPLAAAMVKHWCDVHALNPRAPANMLTAARKISLLMDRWPDRKWPGE